MRNRKLINLKSTVNKQGDKVSQIIHFVGGVKRTYHGILSESIKQGQFTKMVLEDGSMLMVNDDNVLCIEVYKED
tara:strand:+ start:450 stop:674 length:225 start_codon:yes stop_codon:yes gene_type:complete